MVEVVVAKMAATTAEETRPRMMLDKRRRDHCWSRTCNARLSESLEQCW